MELSGGNFPGGNIPVTDEGPFLSSLGYHTAVMFGGSQEAINWGPMMPRFIFLSAGLHSNNAEEFASISHSKAIVFTIF